MRRDRSGEWELRCAQQPRKLPPWAPSGSDVVDTPRPTRDVTRADPDGVARHTSRDGLGMDPSAHDDRPQYEGKREWERKGSPYGSRRAMSSGILHPRRVSVYNVRLPCRATPPTAELRGMSAPWHVSPGGPSHVHVAGDVEVRKASVGPMDNDANLLTDLDSGERMLVDAAADVDRLLALVSEPDPVGRLDVVVTTHGHADHHGALAAVLDATGASSAVGEADAGDLPVDADRRLAHGDRVAFGGVTLEVGAIRGHTPVSVALVLQPGDGSTHLFTGRLALPRRRREHAGRRWPLPAADGRRGGAPVRAHRRRRARAPRPRRLDDARRGARIPRRVALARLVTGRRRPDPGAGRTPRLRRCPSTRRPSCP